MNESLVNLITNYGLGTTLAIAITSMFIMLIRWVLKQQETVLTHAKEERTVWQGIIGDVKNSLNEHTANAKEFHTSMMRASDYQRSEHKQMCDGFIEAVTLLKNINGKRKCD